MMANKNLTLFIPKANAGSGFFRSHSRNAPSTDIIGGPESLWNGIIHTKPPIQGMTEAKHNQPIWNYFGNHLRLPEFFGETIGFGYGNQLKAEFSHSQMFCFGWLWKLDLQSYIITRYLFFCQRMKIQKISKVVVWLQKYFGHIVISG